MALGVQIANFYYSGTAQLNEIFGGYTAPSAVQIQRLQVSSRMPAIGGNIVIELVDENGASLGASITLMASTKYKDYPLPATVTLVAGDAVFAKITEIDLGVAQDFNLILIGATSQGIPQPICQSCCC
ncbi:MAG: hypothetical protein V4710_01270 [Verrucomicrobiota bacterium]